MDKESTQVIFSENFGESSLIWYLNILQHDIEVPCSDYSGAAHPIAVGAPRQGQPPPEQLVEKC